LNGLWWKSILLLFLLAILNSVLIFLLPGKPGVQKGFSLGVIISVIFVIISQVVWTTGHWEILEWTGWIILLSTYLGYDMPSWSPLWRAEIKELVTGVKHTLVEVIPEQCIGCGLCAIVCPADVFKLDLDIKKSMVVQLDACQACGACIENCPGICSCPTCTVINSVQSSKRKILQREKEKKLAVLSNCCDSEDCGCSETEQTQHQ